MTSSVISSNSKYSGKSTQSNQTDQNFDQISQVSGYSDSQSQKSEAIIDKERLIEKYKETSEQHKEMMVENQKRRKEKELKLQQEEQKKKKAEKEQLDQRKNNKQQAYIKYLRNNSNNLLENFKKEKSQKQPTSNNPSSISSTSSNKGGSSQPGNPSIPNIPKAPNNTASHAATSYQKPMAKNTDQSSKAYQTHYTSNAPAVVPQKPQKQNSKTSNQPQQIPLSEYYGQSNSQNNSFEDNKEDKNNNDQSFDEENQIENQSVLKGLNLDFQTGQQDLEKIQKIYSKAGQGVGDCTDFISNFQNQWDDGDSDNQSEDLKQSELLDSLDLSEFNGLRQKTNNNNNNNNNKPTQNSYSENKTGSSQPIQNAYNQTQVGYDAGNNDPKIGKDAFQKKEQEKNIFDVQQNGNSNVKPSNSPLNQKQQQADQDPEESGNDFWNVGVTVKVSDDQKIQKKATTTSITAAQPIKQEKPSNTVQSNVKSHKENVKQILDTHQILQNETIEEAIGFEDEISCDISQVQDNKIQSGNNFNNSKRETRPLVKIESKKDNNTVNHAGTFGNMQSSPLIMGSFSPKEQQQQQQKSTPGQIPLKPPAINNNQINSNPSSNNNNPQPAGNNNNKKPTNNENNNDNINATTGAFGRNSDISPQSERLKNNSSPSPEKKINNPKPAHVVPFPSQPSYASQAAENKKNKNQDQQGSIISEDNDNNNSKDQVSKFQKKLQSNINVDRKNDNGHNQNKKREISPNFTTCTRDTDIDVQQFLREDLININQEEKDLQNQILTIHFDNIQQIREVECQNNIKIDYTSSQQLIKGPAQPDQVPGKQQEKEPNNSQNTPKVPPPVEEDDLEDSIQRLDSLLAQKTDNINQLINNPGSYGTASNNMYQAQPLSFTSGAQAFQNAGNNSNRNNNFDRNQNNPPPKIPMKPGSNSVQRTNHHQQNQNQNNTQQSNLQQPPNNMNNSQKPNAPMPTNNQPHGSSNSSQHITSNSPATRTNPPAWKIPSPSSTQTNDGGEIQNQQEQAKSSHAPNSTAPNQFTPPNIAPPQTTEVQSPNFNQIPVVTTQGMPPPNMMPTYYIPGPGAQPMYGYLPQQMEGGQPQMYPQYPPVQYQKMPDGTFVPVVPMYYPNPPVLMPQNQQQGAPQYLMKNNQNIINAQVPDYITGGGLDTSSNSSIASLNNQITGFNSMPSNPSIHAKKDPYESINIMQDQNSAGSNLTFDPKQNQQKNVQEFMDSLDEQDSTVFDHQTEMQQPDQYSQNTYSNKNITNINSNNNYGNQQSSLPNNSNFSQASSKFSQQLKNNLQNAQNDYEFNEQGLQENIKMAPPETSQRNLPQENSTYKEMNSQMEEGKPSSYANKFIQKKEFQTKEDQKPGTSADKNQNQQEESEEGKIQVNQNNLKALLFED